MAHTKWEIVREKAIKEIARQRNVSVEEVEKEIAIQVAEMNRALQESLDKD